MTSKLKSNDFQRIIVQVPVDYYEKGVKENIFQRYWHTKKWRTLRKLLDGRQGALLDVGCADGTTTMAISKILPKTKITGLDYYKKAIEFARKKKSNIKFVWGDAGKLPFKDKSFETVCAIEVLEHLENSKSVLAEIRRVLKDNGHLIIGQDTNSLLFRTIWWFWTKWKGSVWKNSHINCVDPKTLTRNIEKNGFDVTRHIYVNLGMEVFIDAVKK